MKRRDVGVLHARPIGRGPDRPVLLVSLGACAAVLYPAIVVVAARLTPGYSHIAQPVSSLYEAGAPLGAPIAAAFATYNVLVAGFGFGLARAAMGEPARRSAARAAGIAIVLVAVAGALDDVFRQDPIGSPVTTTGTLHITFAAAASLLSVAAVGLTAWWLRAVPELRWLAWFSIGALVTIAAAGPATAVATAAASPVMGLLERVTILTFTTWLGVTSVALARRERGRARRTPAS